MLTSVDCNKLNFQSDDELHIGMYDKIVAAYV